jgi:drug/metabolite transporter (DMT)-like permease
MRREVKTNGALVTAIAAISFAAIFIRLAHAPATVIAAYRMVFSTIVLLPFVCASRGTINELCALSPKQVLLLILSGMLLSLHFISWIASLSLTGVPSSVVLVTTTPLFVALYSVLVFKERVPAVFWSGLALAAVGGIIIGGGDFTADGVRWKGDLLAVTGALAAAGYFIVGSRMRRRLSLLAYVFPVYLSASLIILAVALVTRTALAGYRGMTYMYCFLLAVVCQIMGHTLFNWALRHVRATTVTFGILGEPVGATVLAFLILGEAPLAREVAGGLFILAGLFVVIYFRGGRQGLGLDVESVA